MLLTRRMRTTRPHRNPTRSQGDRSAFFLDLLCLRWFGYTRGVSWGGGLWGPGPPGVTKGAPKRKKKGKGKGKKERERGKIGKKRKKKGIRKKKWKKERARKKKERKKVKSL